MKEAEEAKHPVDWARVQNALEKIAKGSLRARELDLTKAPF